MALAGALGYLGRSVRDKLRATLGGDDADVLLVTAHPDDECMFFTPTIRTLVERTGAAGGGPESAGDGCGVALLCLSNGDAAGLGAVREKELLEAAEGLGVPRDDVTVLNDERLQDGMRTTWPAKAVCGAVRREVERLRSKPLRRKRRLCTIITFDAGGVSGHPNHRACWEGVSELMRDTAFCRKHNIRAWTLRSEPLFLKYLGPFGAAARYLQHAYRPRLSAAAVCGLGGVSAAAWAMRAHESQMVWFRHFYLAFTTYTMVNILDPLVAMPT
ncbi:unnamed protein product [Pedinophyceae sp. YPF-701]|nr:unnamed protein product [Pedinophyceae sp. YPF-701]